MKSPTQLTLGKIVAHDPIARRLARHLEPLRFGIAGLLLGCAQTLILPVFAGVLEEGSVVDWPNLVVMLVLMPLILGWYAWQPGAIRNVYETLLARTRTKEEGATSPINTLIAPHKSTWLTWVVLAVSIAATAALILRLSDTASPSWENATPALLICRLIIRFVTFYSLLMFLLRQILVSVSINRFFRRFQVNFNPLHPDESGGLRILGHYALNSAGLVMMVGLLLSLQFLSARWGGSPLGPEFIFEVLVYLVAGPAVFFIPLMQSHKQMSLARNKLLVEIAEEFEQLYQVIKIRLSRSENLADALIQLDAVEDLYEVVAKAPSWPFSAAILSRFGGLIAIPILIPAIADVLANLFGNR
jgi:hypothetical protein